MAIGIEIELLLCVAAHKSVITDFISIACQWIHCSQAVVESLDLAIYRNQNRTKLKWMKNPLILFWLWHVFGFAEKNRAQTLEAHHLRQQQKHYNHFELDTINYY